MKEINPLVPSLHQAKKIVLPGYTAPTKVYGELFFIIIIIIELSTQFYAGEIPFYVNLPSTIIRKCLANPCLMKNLATYPQFTEGVIR